jgi:hypothetical protein
VARLRLTETAKRFPAELENGFSEGFVCVYSFSKIKAEAVNYFHPPFFVIHYERITKPAAGGWVWYP